MSQSAGSLFRQPHIRHVRVVGPKGVGLYLITGSVYTELTTLCRVQYSSNVFIWMCFFSGLNQVARKKNVCLPYPASLWISCDEESIQKHFYSLNCSSTLQQDPRSLQDQPL